MICFTFSNLNPDLRIEGIDPGLHEHIGEDKVLETGGSTRRAALVVILEGFEKVGVGLFKLALP